MSASNSLVEARRIHAPIFAALGDETRLSLIEQLLRHSPCSISQLADHSPLTRQGVSKHLTVLKEAGVVTSIRVGRERHYALKLQPIETAKTYLEDVARQWDDALGRLKSFVDG